MQTQLPRVPEPPARTRGPSTEAGLGTGGCALGLDRPSLNLMATYLPFIGLRSPANTRFPRRARPAPIPWGGRWAVPGILGAPWGLSVSSEGTPPALLYIPSFSL